MSKKKVYISKFMEKIPKLTETEREEREARFQERMKEYKPLLDELRKQAENSAKVDRKTRCTI